MKLLNSIATVVFAVSACAQTVKPNLAELYLKNTGLRMIRRWVAILLILSGCSETTRAQVSPSKADANVACGPVLQMEPLAPYGFAKANLASLWYARNAVRDALAEMKQTQNEANAFSALTAMMRSTKVSTNDFICAKKLVRPYASSKSRLTAATESQKQNIQTAAKFALMVYDEHIDINSRMLKLIKKMTTNLNQAELSDQISTLQVERGQRWADLVTPSSMALLMLVDLRPTDDNGNFIQTTDPNVGETKRLIITKKQKQELLDWANEHFNEFRDGTPRDQWSDPAKTAELYTKFFDGRKCADE